MYISKTLFSLGTVIALGAPAVSMAATLSNSSFTGINLDQGSVSGASSSGADGTWNVFTAPGNGTNQYMNLTTTYAAGMSNIGDKLVVSFDFTLAQDVPADEGADFRFTIFDTTAGAEMIALIRLGNQAGTNPTNNSMIRARFDTDLGTLNNGGGTFLNSFAPGSDGAGIIGLPLWKAGDVHTFTTTLERLTATTLSYELSWSNVQGTASASTVYDETSGAGANGAEDIWPGGKVNQMDGFALTIFSNDPFDSSDGQPGSGTISNFTVTGTPVPEPSAGLLGVLAIAAGVLRRQRA